MSSSPPPPAAGSPRHRPLGRRAFAGVLGAGALGAAGLAAAAPPARAAATAAPGRAGAAARRTAYLGTFGGGVVVCAYDTATGALTRTGSFDGATDPSFLALGPGGTVLYALDTVGGEGGVRALAVGPDGRLSPLGEAQSTGGRGVTHLSVHPGGRYLLSANYDSGSVAVHPLGEDGGVGPRTALVQHTGTGPDPERQEGPHAHQILTDPSGDHVYAVDLGNDTLYTYRLDTGSGQLTEVSTVKSAPGAGPRHLLFHPGGRHAYVANELDGTLTRYAHDPATGALTRGESVSTLPAGTQPPERNYPAELVLSPDSRFLYVSNRGHDSVARFRVAEDGGAVEIVDTVPSGGAYPRHLALDPTGRLLWTGNQNSGTVGVFTRDAGTGALTPSGEPFAATSPVCVLPS